MVSATGSWQGVFGHAGGFGYQSDASGLQLLGHRYYDPSTGRFLTRDPIKDGRNWYAYGAGEAAPTGMADPTGLIRIDLVNGMYLRVDTNQLPHPNAHLIRPGKPEVTVILPNGKIPPTHGGKPNPGLTPGERRDLDKSRGMKEAVKKMKAICDGRGIDWRAIGGRGLGLAVTLAMIGGEALGNLIDPIVDDSNRGFNGFARKRWLDAEDGALLGP